uniref:Uncharacterized protein n=1 Tax=Chromera velia CCMP2878 TaxID=1169474 RepID=A0A0G4H1P4_9ALVE|eukprot:Cvel_5559.t1-p1 / transcript=Cvel_5559.t1 / gene=Cvel_5559 / organism=Chromera_velia_CCMP2878 / gene_product=Zinc finger protein 331, putative / transcript_product=Zinc finger protein 331, putative / location=Cvel_scaffold261:32594-33112(+) / protein_length=173 / sequence_SO=supercontig / SO=protein_coding / is_pseudo=false
MPVQEYRPLLLMLRKSWIPEPLKVRWLGRESPLLFPPSIISKRLHPPRTQRLWTDKEDLSVRMVDANTSAKSAVEKEFVNMVGDELSVKNVGGVPYASTGESSIPVPTVVEVLSANTTASAANVGSVEEGGFVNTAVNGPCARNVVVAVSANMDVDARSAESAGGAVFMNTDG